MRAIRNTLKVSSYSCSCTALNLFRFQTYIGLDKIKIVDTPIKCPVSSLKREAFSSS